MGLGLRIHYNSDELTFVDVSNVYSKDLSAIEVVKDDDSNFDENPSTNKFVIVAWINYNEQWPNEALPIELYTANFIISESLSSEDTSIIDFSTSSKAARYGLEKEIITVSVI